MSARLAKRWTAAEARELNAKNAAHWPRYEVVDGELLVTPAPRPIHQYAVGELAFRLERYVRQHRIGHTLTAPADIELEEDSTVAPDVFVIPRSAGPRPSRWSEITTLLLAAEVLSPSTARADRVKKRRYFTRNRVPHYWIIDCDARVVEVWRPGARRPLVRDVELTWTPAGAPEAFALDLPAYFRDVFGEGQAMPAPP
jgi:Uma2 family endonuclease